MGKMAKMTVWMGMAAAMVIGGASTARADQKILATVPFDFIVGDSRFPAGNYVVTEASQPEVVSIESADGRQFAFLLTIPDAADRDAAPELVFERFGSEHFLARISDGDGEAREIPLTPASVERDLERVALHQRAAR
jgi:hypothetical protein